MANSKAKNRGNNRPNRVPVSGRRDVMTVADKDNAFVYRWVNDTQGRIDQFLAGGYEFVQDDLAVGDISIDSSSDISSMVSKGVGSGTTAYLMRISKELYNEDRAAANRAIDESESDMKRTLNSGNDGTYGEVKIS